MQILLNGIRVNTERIHKLTNEQINHALGGKHKNPEVIDRAHLEEDLIALIKEKQSNKRGRRNSPSTTKAAAINKAWRIKKAVHFGTMTVERAKQILSEDKLLQKHLTNDDIDNAVHQLKGFITGEVIE